MPLVRVVIGEARYLARQGLVGAFEAAGGIVVVAACSELGTLREAVRAERPAAVVLGESLFAGNAYAEELRESRPDVALIIVEGPPASHMEPALIERAIANRAHLVRDDLGTSDALVLSVRQAVEGRAPTGTAQMPNPEGQRGDARIAQLTARERDVTRLLAAGASNAAISTQLGITTRAVERHINSIFRKLDISRSGDVNRRVKAALLYTAAKRRAFGVSPEE